MIQLALLLLVFVLFLDLIIYIPLIIHFYIDKSSVYLYLFSLKIIAINNKEDFSLLKDKIDIDKINNAKKENIQIINSININKILIGFNNELSYQYCYILYPLSNVFVNKIKIKVNNHNKLYICIKMTLSNVLKEIINIRRKKNERTPN